MSELSSEARALLRDGLGALRPAANDRARIAGALASRLGPAAMLISKSTLAAPAKAVLLPKLVLTVASVGLVVAGASLWWSPPTVATAPQDASPAQQGLTANQAVARPEPEARAQPAPALEEAPRPSDAKPSSVKAVDPLAAEVAILSRAMTVLRAGNPTEALRLLESHRQQFPSGRLVEERRAGRLQALCALGRRSEAASELARLEREAPRSPHVARARRACGLD
jgi:hypothetical protein